MAKKILIVEDDKFLRELIFEKLDSEGYEISKAADGEEGVKKAGEEKPDLILLDLILPGMDGFEVLSKIRENKELAQMPIIILSNLGQKEDIERGLTLGATDFMVKAHFTPNEIVDKIKKVLG